MALEKTDYSHTSVYWFYSESGIYLDAGSRTESIEQNPHTSFETLHSPAQLTISPHGTPVCIQWHQTAKHITHLDVCVNLCTLFPWPRICFLMTLHLVKSYPFPHLSTKATSSVKPFVRALCPLPEKRITSLWVTYTPFMCAVLIRVHGSERRSHPSFPLLCELFTGGACSNCFCFPSFQHNVCTL